MRRANPAIVAALEAGHLVGARRPSLRITVDVTWWLHEVSGPFPATKAPYRWWQRRNNSQVELEIPYEVIESATVRHSVDEVAATLSLTLANVLPGQVGALTPWRGEQPDANGRYGISANSWAGRLRRNNVLRVYVGYANPELPLQSLIASGEMVLDGVFSIDRPEVSGEGRMQITARGMGKLLINNFVTRPAIPAQNHPLRYQRWRDVVEIAHSPGVAAVPGYGESDGHGKTAVAMAYTPDGQGYWIFASDGGVFAYGSAAFYGSMGGIPLNAPIVGAAAHPSGQGYWLFAADGGVFAYGASAFRGSMGGIPLNAPVVGGTATASGGGYWLVASDGGIFAFGDAPFHGSMGGTALNQPIVGMARFTGSGSGYWLVARDGGIFAYGAAVFHGSASALGVVMSAMIPAAGGAGYWIVARRERNGTPSIHAYGAVSGFDASPLDGVSLADPIVAAAPSPSAAGLALLGADGGVFCLGDAAFYGSLPGGKEAVSTTVTSRFAGNLTDHADMIKDLALWAGWLLYDPEDPQLRVFGNIATTGTYPEEPVPETFFERQSFADVMTAIAESLGFLLYLDEQGALHFHPPNWYSIGNRFEDGTTTSAIVEVTDLRALSAITTSEDDAPLRSEIVVASQDPLVHAAGTIATTFIPPNVSELRGQIRPAAWINEHFKVGSEQISMAQMIWLQLYLSSVSSGIECLWDPRIQVDDQIRVYDETTSEGRVHWVKSKDVTWSRQTGELKMALETVPIGDSRGITAFNLADFAEIRQQVTSGAIVATVEAPARPSATLGVPRFWGSMADELISAPIVDGAATASGDGYWLVGSDGAVYAFGDAQFRGGANDGRLGAHAAVAIERARGNDGYWIAASNGMVWPFGDGIISHGNASASGSIITGMTRSVGGNGYLLVARRYPAEMPGQVRPPLGLFSYEPAGTTPSGGCRPGVHALIAVVNNRSGGILPTSHGCYSPRDVDFNMWPNLRSTPSVHLEGRALDLMCNPSSPRQVQEVQRWVDLMWLHHAALGVQAIIWRRKIWRVGSWGWRVYSGRSPHYDHAHIELTRNAAATLTQAFAESVMFQPEPQPVIPTAAWYTYGDATTITGSGVPTRASAAAYTTGGGGLWVVAEDSAMSGYGAGAVMLGAPTTGGYGVHSGGIAVNKIVDMARSPAAAAGYWIFGSDGGVFAYGSATFYGSMGGQALNAPIVAGAVHPAGTGYWLFAADGGVFTFGAT